MGTHEQHLLLHGYQPKFAELWNPEFLAFVVLLGVAYFMLIGPWRKRFSNAEPVSVGKQITFMIALLTLYVAMGSPLYFYGHVSFTLHMTQQSLLVMIFPPLFVLGLPVWFIRAVLQPVFVRRWFDRLTKPLISLFMFNLFFSVYHIPLVLDFVMQYHGVHIAYKLLLLITAFMIWWHIICPVPELQRIKNVKLMGYIFAAGVLMTPACALIIFASQLVYESYSYGPQLFAILPILDDQQLGGVVMKMVQETAYGVGLWHVFSKWYREENPTTGIDEIDPLESFEPMEQRKELTIVPTSGRV
ncbi:cytochrome AA3 [Brevibacillus sp. 7WMA2]|uniref:cytochrome c oxidase assembly protein n=1 Tax=Brevibacillus TaxID=55080 RepID=UPI000839D095|nr:MULTISPECIES: cytochrome c oxidase assembly protein [Brevibacillus]AYK06942.1 cytochrome AA3 [Brevibacillus laterosporus]MCR8994227.1 cytochrome c oxidase assembly protein [Brevibacillus laterosporus]PCN44934.1 cytochrome AA3 [Brevibacillus laterosporus]QIC07876.1 cytochrome AA3 [Brevibacillus sp. 7WMA2]